MKVQCLHSKIDVKEHNAVTDSKEGYDEAGKKQVSGQA